MTAVTDCFFDSSISNKEACVDLLSSAPPDSARPFKSRHSRGFRRNQFSKGSIPRNRIGLSAIERIEHATNRLCPSAVKSFDRIASFASRKENSPICESTIATVIAVLKE